MAFFFKKFPKIDYSFIQFKKSKKITNILTAFFLRKISFNQILMYESYIIKDDDTPESLSQKIYHTPMYYWTCLLVNDIIDPYSEWALSSDLLEKFVAKKYQQGRQQTLIDGTQRMIPLSRGIEGIHHFMNIKTGRQCDEYEDDFYRTLYQDDPLSIGLNILPVSNLTYESDLNLAKRQIFLVSQKNITSFEEDFNKMLSGSSSQ